MKIELLQNCLERVPRNCRLMGIDLGTKTIGIAISDSGQSIATPLATIKRTKFSKDVVELGNIVKEYEIGGYIIGWPLNMDGSEGAGCDRVRSFADEFSRNVGIVGKNPFFAYCDERLSTQEVDNSMDKRVDMKRNSKKNAKKSGLIDKLAAQIILQSALDSLN